MPQEKQKKKIRKSSLRGLLGYAQYSVEFGGGGNMTTTTIAASGAEINPLSPTRSSVIGSDAGSARRSSRSSVGSRVSRCSIRKVRQLKHPSTSVASSTRDDLSEHTYSAGLGDNVSDISPRASTDTAFLEQYKCTEVPRVVSVDSPTTASVSSDIKTSPSVVDPAKVMSGGARRTGKSLQLDSLAQEFGTNKSSSTVSFIEQSLIILSVISVSAAMIMILKSAPGDTNSLSAANDVLLVQYNHGSLEPNRQSIPQLSRHCIHSEKAVPRLQRRFHVVDGDAVLARRNLQTEADVMGEGIDYDEEASELDNMGKDRKKIQKEQKEETKDATKSEDLDARESADWRSDRMNVLGDFLETAAVDDDIISNDNVVTTKYKSSEETNVTDQDEFEEENKSSQPNDSDTAKDAVTLSNEAKSESAISENIGGKNNFGVEKKLIPLIQSADEHSPSNLEDVAFSNAFFDFILRLA